MSSNPNIYSGDKRRHTNLVLDIIIPDGIGQEDFIDIIIKYIRNGNINYTVHSGTVSKSVSAKDIINSWAN